MASGLFTLLDDIAALMDDVAVATKIATKKAAGILGDDLAVNAEKSMGFVSSRELPVIWKITKGAFLNKVIIVPLIFLLHFFLPFAIKIILVIGGIYLAFEGAEKCVEFIVHRNGKENNKVEKPTPINNEDAEKKKIKSAVKTDFILSIEIIIIALTAVIDKPLSVQIIAVVSTAIIATVGVYGLVALIVRMDDVGYKMIQQSNNSGFSYQLGKLLVNALPVVVKSFSVIGTIALFLVSGGLFVHTIHFLHDYLHGYPALLVNFSLGVLVGFLAVGIMELFHYIRRKA